MKDLYRYIGEYKSEYILEGGSTKYKVPFDVELQLAYVLPRAKLNLSTKCDYLLEKYPENYPEKYGFQWAFCRYFWEAHPLLPYLSLEKLEALENELTEK
jgi:hypothetical protein